jgi:hypothetical protein
LGRFYPPNPRPILDGVLVGDHKTGPGRFPCPPGSPLASPAPRTGKRRTGSIALPKWRVARLTTRRLAVADLAPAMILTAYWLLLVLTVYGCSESPGHFQSRSMATTHRPWFKAERNPRCASWGEDEASLHVNRLRQVPSCRVVNPSIPSSIAGLTPTSAGEFGFRNQRRPTTSLHP